MAMSPNVLFLFSSRRWPESSATGGRSASAGLDRDGDDLAPGAINEEDQDGARFTAIPSQAHTRTATAADRALARMSLPATTRALVDELSITRQGVERILRDLVRDGRLVKGPRGPGGHVYYRPDAPPEAPDQPPAARMLLSLLCADRFTALSELLPRLGVARTYASTLANDLADRGLVEKIRRSGRPYLRLMVDMPAAAEPTLVIAANRRAILEVLQHHGALTTAQIRHHAGEARWAAAKVPLKIEMQILRRQALIETAGEGEGTSRPRYRVTLAGSAALTQLQQSGSTDAGSAERFS